MWQRQAAVIGQLATADYQRWQAQAASFPPARLTVLAGHTRSGTTLLEQRLTAFPDAIGTDESGVFNREFARTCCMNTPALPLMP